MFAMMRAAFPDLEMIGEDMVAEGDKVFVRGRMRGTHKGEFMGIPASGNAIDVPMGDFIRIVDGQVGEHWGATDTGIMMQQIAGEG